MPGPEPKIGFSFKLLLAIFQEAPRDRLTSAGRFLSIIWKLPKTNKIIKAKKVNKGISKLLLLIFIILARKNIKIITMPTIAIGQKVKPFKKAKIIRPANYPPETPGEGYKIIKINTKSLLIINLIGRVFMHENFDCPFRALDDILDKTKRQKIDGIFVDFHAEATSEKVAFGWHADGKVSTVVGTHTHVQTSDEKILPQGTAYISDVGMVGGFNSVIGANKENVLKSFLTQISQSMDAAEDGPAARGTNGQ